jgi:hypothetical protein
MIPPVAHREGQPPAGSAAGDMRSAPPGPGHGCPLCGCRYSPAAACTATVSGADAVIPCRDVAASRSCIVSDSA